MNDRFFEHRDHESFRKEYEARKAEGANTNELLTFAWERTSLTAKWLEELNDEIDRLHKRLNEAHAFASNGMKYEDRRLYSGPKPIRNYNNAEDNNRWQRQQPSQ